MKRRLMQLIRQGIKVTPLVMAPLVIASLVMACAPSEPSPIHQYAQCLANPESPLHFVTGNPTYEEVRAGVEAELAAGETSLEEIEAALKLFCEDGDRGVREP